MSDQELDPTLAAFLAETQESSGPTLSNVSNKLTETGPFSAASFNANREESAEKQKQASKVDHLHYFR